jgi:transporter family protein
MSWIFFTLLAVSIYSVGCIVDKYALTKWIRNPIVSVMFYGIVDLPVIFLVYAFHGFSFLSNINIALAFTAGIINILAIYFYFKAVKIEEISRIVPLAELSTLFVSIFAAIFLGEIFNTAKYIGIILLVIGAIIISSKDLKITFGIAFWFIILFCIITAVNSILVKYVLNFADYWTIISYTRMGAVFTLIPIIYFNFHELRYTVKECSKKAIVGLLLNEFFMLIGGMLFLFAVSTGTATLTNALLSVQPLFVLLFSVMLSIFYPNILKEEISQSTVLTKFIAVAFMFAGVFLIT